MAVKTSLAVLLSSAALWALPAQAQSPLVHLPLDGSAANSGSAGAAELLAPAGADQPQFIAGHSGQALSFGKGGVVAIPYEFNQEEHPQATVTMWIKIDQDSSYERELFSLGPGNGLLMTVSGQRKISVRSYRSAIHDTAFPLGEWVFIAGVVDNDAGSIRIRQNDDVFGATGLDIRKPSSLAVTAPGSDERKHYIFVGADDFNSAAKELKHIALDDVRLYASALSAAQIDSVRNAGPATVAEAPAEDTNADTEENEGGVYASLPQEVTRPLPDTTGAELPAEAEAESASTRPAYPEIATLPDDGPKITAGLPPAEEASDSPSWEDIGTGGRDVSGIDTSGVKRPIDLSKEQPSTEEQTSQSGDEGVIEHQQSLEAQSQGKIYPKGEKKYSSISGVRGDSSSSFELDSSFIGRIDWREAHDKPCLFTIAQYDNNDVRTDWNHCTSNLDAMFNGGYSQTFLQPHQAIGRLQICQSNQPGSKRLKGITIWGDRIRSDGSTVYEPDAYSKAEKANCGKWMQDVSCPLNTKATGLILHYNGGPYGNSAVTGLQLICREIGVR